MPSTDLQKSSIVRAAVLSVPGVLPYLSERAVILCAGKAEGDLGQINAGYHDAITQALTNYFEGAPVTGPRNEFKKATVEALGGAFDAGWVDGGKEMPPSADALSWYNARIEQEMGYIDQLFQQAKELRAEEGFDYFSWITEKADGYTQTTSSVYQTGKMYANKSQMGTWRLGQTEKHCKDCARLNGQRHRLSWFLARGYLPRTPGASQECGGYNCDCSILDDEGNEITL